MRSTERAVLILVCLALSLTPASAGTRDACGDAAEAMLFKVDTWRDLARYWEQFPACDDGYFGEHISELVSSWLAQRPTTIAKLTIASRRHPTLLPLVLRHIDTLSSARAVNAIRENADRRCPAGGESVCRQIVQRVDELKRELARN
jgi:hypothetical protein